MIATRFSQLFRVSATALKRFQRNSGSISNTDPRYAWHPLPQGRGEWVHMHYETTGNGPQSVVLMPGAIGSTRTDFSYQLELFNKKDFTLIAVDPRGYGNSRPPTRDWPPKFLHRDADDIMELVNKLNLKNVSLVGWSDGGITAMIAAAKFPDTVKKLVVWGSNSYITQPEMEIYESIRDVSAWSDRMRAPFIELYGEEYFRTHWSNWIDAIQHYFQNNNGDICKGDMEKIKAETLIIHGMKDALVPFEHPDYLHAHIKGSRLYILPDGKHNLHQRYHKEFNTMVEHFLKL